MKLREIKGLLNADGVDFLERHGRGDIWNAEAIFVQDGGGNWLNVCVPGLCIFAERQEPYILSLAKLDSGGAKSTFWGDLQHFAKIMAANVAYRRGHRRNGLWCENVWYNWEYYQRVRKWLKYRYGFKHV